jgi:hypothetical protein
MGVCHLNPDLNGPWGLKEIAVTGKAFRFSLPGIAARHAQE